MSSSPRFDDCQTHASRAGLSPGKHQKKLRALSELLQRSERLLSVTAGTAQGNLRENLIALTSERLLILKDNPKDAVSINLDRITRINGKKGISTGRIDVFLRDSKLTISFVHRESVEAFIQSSGNALKEGNDVSRSTRLSPDVGPANSAKTDSGVAQEGVPIVSLTEEERATEYRRMAMEIGDDRLFTRGELKHLPTVMMPGELLIWFGSGVLESTGKEWNSGGGRTHCAY
ncbi:MAG: PH domain-containing protein [Chloroflexi bacterium]|nr:PH domain-containing protein [Chloroflexota bacterium]MDE2709854.1 PH domain-containing protein [Chloroflexota bacterium]